MLFNLFMPHAQRKLDAARQQGLRMAHYCSAESGINILRSGEVFLRNSTLMNDFSEVAYGRNLLANTWHGAAGEQLQSILNGVDASIVPMVKESVDGALNDLLHETYLVSLSEHQATEDQFGRLSMWRAYAPKDGVALILNNTAFLTESNSLNAFTSPVLYAGHPEFEREFAAVVGRLSENVALLKQSHPQQIAALMTNALIFAIQSTKHPAFAEEREWRVIYTPTILQRAGLITEEQLRRVPTKILSLRGVPQRIYTIPFRNYPDEGFTGAEIPELIERILIGPSMDAYAIAQAFVAELGEKGVPETDQRVFITDIPLRHQ